MSNERCPNCIILADKLGAALDEIAEYRAEIRRRMYRDYCEVPIFGAKIGNSGIIVWKGKD